MNITQNFHPCTQAGQLARLYLTTWRWHKVDYSSKSPSGEVLLQDL